MRLLLPAAAVSLILVLSSAERPANAATINVPCNIADLVAAVNTANNETTNPGADTLELAGGCNYVFSAGHASDPTNALPAVTSTITIDGNHATISRDAGGALFRFFLINTGATLNVFDTTITGGRIGNNVPPFGISASGGAVAVQGTLTLTNSTVSGNRTGDGATNSGHDGGSGGAIYVDPNGSLNILNSTFSGNRTGNGGSAPSGQPGSGGSGGAVFVFSGSLTVANSTFSGNIAGNGGQSAGSLGGIGGDGSAIYAYESSFSVVNSTISGNTAGNGGSGSPQGPAGSGGIGITDTGAAQGTVTNSTIAENNGGSGLLTGVGGIVFSGGEIVRNTLISSSTGGGNCSGTPNPASATNIASDNTCGASFAFSTPALILLGPLADNGGPTLTRSLHPTSSAVDAGDNNICAALPVNNLDQRGVVRPLDGKPAPGTFCDVGAYEAPGLQPGPTFTVDTTAPDNDGACHSAPLDCSLREAITAANADGVASTVVLANDETYSLNAVDNVNNGLPIISTNITIEGNGSTIVRDAAAPQFRIIEVSGTGSLNLQETTISGGRAPNTASFGGGGINVESGGALHVSGSTISGNTSGNGASSGQDGRPGGGIQLGSATLTLVDSTVSGNTTGNGANGSGFGSAGGGGRGGGIHAQATSNVTITRSTIKDNSTGDGGTGGASAGSGGAGAGLYIDTNATASVANSTIANNIAGDRGGIGGTGGSGGGIRNTSANLTLTNVTLAGNAVGSGGSAGTGGNISTSAAILAKNSIASAPALGANCAGTAFNVASVANLASDTSCVNGFGQQTTGQINLGSLASNGGPTQTMALVYPSTAIDAGNAAACTAAPVSNVDQRGNARPEDGDGSGTPACDVGAFEAPHKCPDADSDGVCTEDDNCPNAANPAQEDFDGDGVGDACDSELIVDTTSDANLTACTVAVADCSLRGAINASNSTVGRQTIYFSIPPGGVQTITLTASLPTVTGEATIDGTTQQGYSGTPIIELNANTLVTGLQLMADNNIVRGLVINRASARGLYILSDGNSVSNSYFGTNVAGTAALPNGSGVAVDSAGNNCIGGRIVAAVCTHVPGDRNLLSGNTNTGISIAGSSAGNIVLGNYIGTDAAGANAVPNGGDGVFVQASGNTIGGTSGTSPGGACTGACNLVSGNGSHGMRLVTAQTTVIQGNLVGTDASGNLDLGNAQTGIRADISTVITGTAIGSGTPEGRNVISGNNSHGIDLPGSTLVTIRGNYIGTNSAGTADLGNTQTGINSVHPTGAANITIGGSVAGQGNVISGNNSVGVLISSDNNTLRGNYIGTAADGTSPLGNGGDGVRIPTNGLTGNIIGGAAAGEGNTIAFNPGNGVTVIGSGSTGNTIRGNSIHSNTGLGIDNSSGGNGEPAHAPPVINAANRNIGTACPNCTVDFYSDDANEGRVYHGSVVAAVDGTWNFAGVIVGPNLTATATNGAGSTTEFSAPCGDPDLDVVCTSVDNCPNWSNPAQTLPSWTIPANDPDCDGFSTAREVHVGTDPLWHCNDNSGFNNEPDAWPTDFNDSRLTDLSDVVSMGPTFNKLSNQDGYNQRYDLDGSNSVLLGDVIAIGPFWLKFCN